MSGDATTVQDTDAPAAPVTGLVRVESARIMNLRGLTDCTVALEPGLTLLIGRNSSGKSRILRALALSFGTTASGDDFTVGSEAEPTVDVVLAPASKGAQEFDSRVSSIFGQHVQLTSVSGAERIAWRTVVRRSAEGWGGRLEARFLRWDVPTTCWRLPEHAAAPDRLQRNVVVADLVETGRDLAAELSRPGSAVRRVLSDLDVPQLQRQPLENALQDLGSRIVDQSNTLDAVRTRLQQLQRTVGSIGSPDVRALPGRLEELVRLVEIGLDTGSGGLPMRLHGSGARSLSSLQIQSVLYDRRIGKDGGAVPTHALTLLEEPESHLHPQACLELGQMLLSIPGQVVASTHSSHLVSTVATSSLRLIRQVDERTIVRDLTPVQAAAGTPNALRLDVSIVEWEKIKRLVERPFGEILFAHGLVIGDGASERAFIPYLLNHAFGAGSAGICVVDPNGMTNAKPLIKYAEAADIPCIVFLDGDSQGRKDEKGLPDYARRVWAMGTMERDGALEEVLAEHDSDWCLSQCSNILASVEGDALTRLKKLKGSYGGPLGRSFVDRFPIIEEWPLGFRQLIDCLGYASRSEEST